jgi:heme-degrading monooxygenase HmoA
MRNNGVVDLVARTPDPPYYAVIFTSLRAAHPGDGYDETADRMFELASAQPGFLGVETAREEAGITVSYWTDLNAIAMWKANTEHVAAQREGGARWYDHYTVRVARVEREYGFTR